MPLDHLHIPMQNGFPSTPSIVILALSSTVTRANRKRDEYPRDTYSKILQNGASTETRAKRKQRHLQNTKKKKKRKKKEKKKKKKEKEKRKKKYKKRGRNG